MKIANLYKTTALLLVVLFTSCDKFLDIQPKGVVIPSKLDDYIALMSAPLEITRTGNNMHYFTDEITLPDAYRPSVAGSFIGNVAIRGYDFEKELYDVSENDLDWNLAYRAIYITNTVLVGLETNTENNLAKKNQVKGEALVHRAFYYLMLVNEYAKHYSTTAATDLGVPMPLKPDINALPDRASVKAVYDQIEKDLLTAADILPEKSAYTYRPNKAGAYGVLARMYLYMGNWEKTYEYANKAFAISNFIYDYNTFSWTNTTNPAAGQLLGYASTSVDKRHIVLLKYMAKVGSYGDYYFLYSDSQKSLYETNDLRFTFGATTKKFSGAALLGFGIMDNSGVYDYNNGGITTQELVLMRAEASARLNHTQAALDDLDLLRKKRFSGTYVNLTATTPAAALDLVLKERRLELAFQGFRLIDIKRLNLEGRNISIVHGAKTLSANDPRFVLPIPSKVISLNPNIAQNPR